MGHHDEIKFCQRCGHALVEKEFEGNLKPTCPNCGLVVFLDPKVAVVVLVSMDEKLVLIKRGTIPHVGKWSFPGGYVDRGEAVEDAAVRECREETGVVCSNLTHLVKFHQGLDVVNSYCHVFYSKQFIETDDKLLDPKESVEHYWIPIEQCLGMIFSGQIADSFTIASLLSFRAIAPDLADKEASNVKTH